MRWVGGRRLGLTWLGTRIGVGCHGPQPRADEVFEDAGRFGVGLVNGGRDSIWDLGCCRRLAREGVNRTIAVEVELRYGPVVDMLLGKVAARLDEESADGGARGPPGNYSSEPAWPRGPRWRRLWRPMSSWPGRNGRRRRRTGSLRCSAWRYGLSLPQRIPWQLRGPTAPLWVRSGAFLVLLRLGGQLPRYLCSGLPQTRSA